MRSCSEHGTNSNVCDDEGCFDKPMPHIQIVDKWNVEARNESGEVIVRASRAETGASWFIGKIIDGKMVHCAEIHPWVDEHTGRHLVFAIIGALIP